MAEAKFHLYSLGPLAVIALFFSQMVDGPIRPGLGVRALPPERLDLLVDQIARVVPCDTTITFDQIWSVETPEDVVPFAVQPAEGGEWLLLISKSPSLVAGVYPNTKSTRILFASSDIEPVGARWRARSQRERHLELVSRDGRVIQIPPAADGQAVAREPVTIYELPIQPLRAMWAHGAWFVAAVDSIAREAQLYRVVSTARKVETDTLLGLSLQTEDGGDSWNTNDPFAFSASQDGILVTERHSPYRVHHVSANSKDITKIVEAAAYEPIREQVEATGSGRWIGMNTIELGGRWRVQTLSDTRSDRRIIALYRGSDVIRVHAIDAPMSFVAILDSVDAEVVAVSNFTKFAVTGYRWRPVCSERPDGHVSSLPKGDVR